MNRHYSESKIVNWIRIKIFKIEKPHALPWNGWKIWDDNLKKERPFAFFITEVLPDWIEWIPNHSIEYVDIFRYYIANRIAMSHCLDSTLKKGIYHEFSERLLYSAFDSYVEFIETEEAHMHVVFENAETKTKYNVPWWRQYRIFRWGQQWRCPEAAIDHLKWEMTLDQPNPSDPTWVSSPYQASSAREKMALYTWWKHIRPQRGSAWEVSGFNEFWAKMDTKYSSDWMNFGGKSKLTASEQRKYDQLQKDNDALEELWIDEDEQMLIRLMKIRKNIWT